ncbi:thiamine-phosphate kinase [archaeon]|nr:thiamine-phosphate kinase [archaeon]
MKLSQLGERRIIEIFARNFDRCGSEIVGIGDDAAVFAIDGENYLVVSTDLITQKGHMPREMTPRQIGKYAVNVNLSDIASMGAKPLGLLFSFGLPSDLSDEFVEEISKGVNETCKEHGTCVLGGDTKKHSEIVISGTALGKVKKDAFLTRAGAQAGDIIGVTGKIGSAAAGFYCLINNIEGGEKFIKAALEPTARIREGQVLAKYASSCMDISDGLAWSLHEIAKASGRGFRVIYEKIPVESGIEQVAERSGVSPEEIIFHKGGDFELLFTASKEKFETIEKEIGVKAIGEIIEKGTIIEKDGKESILEPRGHDSFSK